MIYSGDHIGPGMPPHMYGIQPPYRMMSSYCSAVSTPAHGLAPQASWGSQPPSAEKMEPPFFYPNWNQENQLRLPIPCDSQSFGNFLKIVICH